MAIATALAVAGIAAAGSIAGGVMSSKAQKSAANTASQTAKDTAATNNALAANIYGQNQQALAPFQQRGNAAGDAINALLGLPGQQMNQMRFGDQGPPSGYMGGQGFGDGMIERRMGEENPAYMGRDNFSAMQYGQPQSQPVNPQYLQTSPQAAPDYNQAFNNYQNSTGYQFRMGEGVRALDAAASAGGVRNSGAAQKSLAKYGQNIASGEFQNYMAMLANQQGVGLSGASAQAGVGQNYVNTVSGNNNSAGTAAANAALFKGQANANMWGNIGNAVGTFASSF